MKPMRLNKSLPKLWRSNRLITILLTALLGACTSLPTETNVNANTSSSANKTQANQNPADVAQFKPKLTNQGSPLYGVLVNKSIGELYKGGRLNAPPLAQQKQLFKKLSLEALQKALANPKQTERKYPNYELITVYEAGAYPPYAPETASQQQGSLFVDDTFSDLMQNSNLKGKIVYSSDFDENKFLQIAEAAIRWVEESTPFTVEIRTQEAVTEEYSPVTLLITHRPSLKIEKTVFVLNQSAMYADLKSSTPLSRTSHERIFDLGLPFGQSKLKVLVTADDGEVKEVEAIINNTFKAKPTLHLVAVGINEYPFLPIENQLNNAVNDAELVKSIFQDRGKRIFKSDMVIQPYQLSFEQTTKQY